MDLDAEGAQHNAAEDRVAKDAIKHIPLSMDLASIDLIEELHEDEGVEDDCVVLRGRRVKWSITPAVNVKDLFPCAEWERTMIKITLFSFWNKSGTKHYGKKGQYKLSALLNFYNIKNKCLKSYKYYREYYTDNHVK